MADDIRVNKIVAEWEHAREPGAPVAFEPIGDAVPELKRRAEAPESPLVPTGYELHEQVGIGGMGVVFRGFHRSLGREVALKFLRRCYSTDSIAARKFIEEARITACLQHPGIPAVHEVGELDDGRPYLAMKLVRGRTLADLFKEQGYGAAKWLGIFESICQAVGAAHEDDYMHRDLKPANVMIGKFGEVQVMDWGLAKKVPQSVPTPGARTSGATRISEGDGTVDTGPERDTDQTKPHEAHAEIFADETEYGQAKGTPRYMPAEQARGEIDRIDRRVDVFALGAILCEILTGHPPLTSTGMIFKAQVVAGDYSEAGIRLDQCGEDGE